MATKDYIVNPEDFSKNKFEFSAKGKNAIRIDGLTQEQAKNAGYKIDNGKLVMSYDGKTLTISDYTGIKYIKTEYQKVGKKRKL